MAARNINRLGQALDLDCGDGDLHWAAVIDRLRQWQDSGVRFNTYNWDGIMVQHAHESVVGLFQGSLPDDELQQKANEFSNDIVDRLHSLYQERRRDWNLQGLPSRDPLCSASSTPTQTQSDQYPGRLNLDAA
ncbi:MAG: hypothetical protein Q9188_007415 [Gyalolechia gomerana]